MYDYDVVVIGAGQAGLATGHELSRTPLSYVLLEADEQVGVDYSLFYLKREREERAAGAERLGARSPGRRGHIRPRRSHLRARR